MQMLNGRDPFIHFSFSFSTWAMQFSSSWCQLSQTVDNQGQFINYWSDINSSILTKSYFSVQACIISHNISYGNKENSIYFSSTVYMVCRRLYGWSKISELDTYRAILTRKSMPLGINTDTLFSWAPSTTAAATSSGINHWLVLYKNTLHKFH